MRTIKVEELTRDSFSPFGVFYDMLHPAGVALTGELHSFYPDRLSEAWSYRVGFSPITVKRPEKMVITQVEHHFTTPEMILPLDDDMILHVSPATSEYPDLDEAKAFLVPKGTLVKIATAIWHLAPLPANNDSLTAMIILPETTYARDCPVIDLKEEDVFAIER